jgi:hypothetical protein
LLFSNYRLYPVLCTLQGHTRNEPLLLFSAAYKKRPRLPQARSLHLASASHSTMRTAQGEQDRLGAVRPGGGEGRSLSSNHQWVHQAARSTECMFMQQLDSSLMFWCLGKDGLRWENGGKYSSGSRCSVGARGTRRDSRTVSRSPVSEGRTPSRGASNAPQGYPLPRTRFPSAKIMT